MQRNCKQQDGESGRALECAGRDEESEFPARHLHCARDVIRSANYPRRNPSNSKGPDMADKSHWSADPQKQAEFMEDLKRYDQAELAAIHNRLTWLLMPAFFVLLVVLGLSILTWMKVSELDV